MQLSSSRSPPEPLLTTHPNILAKPPHHLISHLKCSLANHVKCVSPRCPIAGVIPDLPSASEAWPVDDSLSLLLGVRPATPSLLPRSLRLRIVWLASGICALEQDLPSALQVWYRGMASHKALFFCDAFFHFSEMHCSDPMGVPTFTVSEPSIPSIAANAFSNLLTRSWASEPAQLDR